MTEGELGVFRAPRRRENDIKIDSNGALGSPKCHRKHLNLVEKTTLGRTTKSLIVKIQLQSMKKLTRQTTSKHHCKNDQIVLFYILRPTLGPQGRAREPTGVPKMGPGGAPEVLTPSSSCNF